VDCGSLLRLILVWPRNSSVEHGSRRAVSHKTLLLDLLAAVGSVHTLEVLVPGFEIVKSQDCRDTDTNEFNAHGHLTAPFSEHSRSAYAPIMINKVYDSALHAVRDIPDGAVIGIGGFGGAGVPEDLLSALVETGSRDLTIVSNNAGNGVTGIAMLLRAGLVRKVVCSFPRQPDSFVFDDLYKRGLVELELVPQGNLAERLRAAGAGIGGFYTQTGVGTPLAEGKETREFTLPLDYSLIKAEKGDRWGNLVYRKTARNFGPVMATASRCTIASVSDVVCLGDLDPEAVVTPGIFVHRVVGRTSVSAQTCR
jgi:3-oxoadipate CoA-transferase alpha subunit